MSLPGPSGVAWALGLLLFGVAFLPAGELIRRTAARWVGLFRNLGWIERGLLDLYLGGAGLYGLAALPLGLFYPVTVMGYLVGAAVLLVLFAARRRSRGAESARTVPFVAKDFWPAGLTLLCVAALYAIEVGVAEGIPTGNTFDSSLLTDFVALLLSHHQIPTSLVPIAAQATAYPQGTTVWLAAAQVVFGLPPARTSLLVTPLFLSLAPLGAYVWGQRLLGSRWAGAAFGVSFALISSWTRVLAGGSNDFAVAFPLVLWLVARVGTWSRVPLLSWSDALAFGALAGYSAALNPVGAEWLLPTLVVFSVLAVPRGRVAPIRWIARWAGAVVAGGLFVLPSLGVIASGHGNPFPALGSVPATPAVPNPGITLAQFFGSIDPFLFGPGDVWLSPFRELRFELAILLVAGLAILLVPGLVARTGIPFPRFRRLLAAGFLMGVLLLLAEVASGSGLSAFVLVPLLSSGAELSILLFALYGAIAAVPLVWLLQRLGGESNDAVAADPTPSALGRRVRASRAVQPADSTRAAVLLLAVAIVLPGAAVTATAFPAYLDTLYQNYGRLTPADFDLLAWSGAHLPAGARVLVAPGGAAQFLPGYADVAIVFPVQPISTNGSYVELDRELVQGNLTARGYAALVSLQIQFVAVTGNNTNLWAPFRAAPLLANPAVFLLAFHEGDAFLFAVVS